MNPRVAMLMVHTCPLEQVGIGDAGGMNIYLATNAAHVNKLIG
jgi:D-inositol-3-phosphate glycosyltransferase